MESFSEYLSEVLGGVKDQVDALKADESEWGMRLKSWIFGKDSPFDKVGTHHMWMTQVAKEVPRAVKLQYPDIVFALQALSLHTNGSKYFKEWEAAKKFLKFNPKYKPITVYRVWKTTEDEIENLQNGKPVFKTAVGEFSSYTHHDSLIKNNRHTISTEFILQTQGQGLMLFTKHTLTPVFDIFYFSVHLVNRLRKVFNVSESELKGLQLTYLHEREVIAPAITKLEASDVVSVYRAGLKTSLSEKPIKVFHFSIPSSTVDDIKNSYAKYGVIDMTFFNNSLVITSHEEGKGSSLTQYTLAKGGAEYHPELSAAVGVKVWVGRW